MLADIWGVQQEQINTHQKTNTGGGGGSGHLFKSSAQSLWRSYQEKKKEPDREKPRGLEKKIRGGGTVDVTVSLTPKSSRNVESEQNLTLGPGLDLVLEARGAVQSCPLPRRKFFGFRIGQS